MDKKITFLINSLATGGAEKVLSVIANALAKENFEVEIVFLEKNEFYELDKRIKKVYLSNSNGNESGLKKLIKLPWLAWKLRNYIKRNNIKFIQSHLFRSHYINVFAKLFGANHKAQLVIPTILSFYDEGELLGKVNLFLIRKLFPKADLIIWKSKGMMLDAKKYLNLNIKEEVIYNPYDLNRIKILSKEKVENFTFKKEKKYIISVGRLIKLKRHKDLIKAVLLLPSNVEVLFLGEGTEKEDLIKLSKDLKVSNRIHFLGQVKNPYKYIKKGHLLVHTSEIEGFPNVIVEALACGVPVIASDCISGPREILFPSSDIRKQLKYDDSFELGDYGILYPIGNTKELGRAIKYLLNNKEIYKNYQAKTSERAKDFSLEKIIEKYKKVLLEEF